MNMRFAFLVITFFLSACAGTQPVLYPNEQLKSAGDDAAQRDIAECKVMAEQAGAKATNKTAKVAAGTTKAGAVGAASGAVGGAVVGSAGRGAAIGAASGATAGLIHGLFSGPKPSQAYMNFVTRCLTERGYEVSGWD